MPEIDLNLFPEGFDPEVPGGPGDSSLVEPPVDYGDGQQEHNFEDP
jgi:hypothetical protein